MEKKNFYITTPIYYPSAKFHIGTAYSTVIADTIARYKKEKGYNTFFLTGVDEHGQKIENVAIERGLTPQEHVDEMTDVAKKLWSLMDIRYDDFIRTTESRHKKVVEEVFEYLLNNDDIYTGVYEGLYCIPCETFFTESQLINNKCPDCNREVTKMKEEAYFFNMKKYEQRLVDYYNDNPDFLLPKSRKNEILNNFIKPGLEDLCVSRTSFNWGIKVKSNPKHVVYVWLDALLNYISALGYKTTDDEKFNKFWPADIQIIGKDIIRFHGIYWPIFLMALDLPLPKTIYAHGWVNMKDGKMSKSKGNVIYPENLIENYGLDALKFYLLTEMPYADDCVFTPEGFVEKYNVNLSNELGNLLHRTISMVNKYFDGKITNYPNKINELEEEIQNYTLEIINNAEILIDECKLKDAILEVWKIVSRTNKYIDETSPWTLAKEERFEELETVMYHLVENLRKVAIFIRPFMEETSNSILNQLGIKENLSSWDSIYDYTNLKDIKVVSIGTPLFNRLEKEIEIEKIIKLMG